MSLAAGQPRRAACGVRPHHRQARAPYGFEERRGLLDLTALGVTLYAVFSPGVTWCTDSSSCCLVIADSVLRLASKSRALLTTCAKVRVVRFSREMRSLLKGLTVSLRPITKMSLSSLSSTADGKLQF